MKQTYYKKFFILFVIVTAVILASYNWSGAYATQTVEAISKLNGEMVNRSAPGFDLEDSNGKKYSLGNFRGKVVFLNFWASFCAPCRQEMPSMEALVRQYKSKGLVMVAVSQDPKKEEMVQFMNTFLPKQQSEMTVLWDKDGKVAKTYGTSLIPETYLIDRNGNMVARFSNSYDWSTPQAKALIEALLKGEKSQKWL